MPKIAEINKVGVVGAGTMGLGIAQVTAMAGYQVVVYDINPEMLEKAKIQISANLDAGIKRGKVTADQKQSTLDAIHYTNKLLEVTGELIIEAVVESLQVKQTLFGELQSINLEQTLYASNTSSIPITQIASCLNHPQNFAGLHFFNPAHIMKLVEVISGTATSPEVLQLMQRFAESLGKTVVVAQDSPGFIVNRVARHYYVESLRVLEEQVATADQIDDLLESYGFPMGPYRLMDLIGIDTNFAVTKSMYEAFYYDPKFRPSRIQQQKVDAGFLGKKSGKGFYDYSD